VSEERKAPNPRLDLPRNVQVAWALIIAAGVTAAVVCFTRFASWTNCWRFAITEGREGPTIYALWRIVHGEPLYEWPNNEPYAITYLNYGFYWTYGVVTRVLGGDAEDLLWLPRVITALGSVAG
jgi:hypothetical protein